MNQLKAKLCYLGGYLTTSVIGPARICINVQTEDGTFSQVEITRDHLVGLILDGIRLLFSNIASAITPRTRSEPAPSTSPANGPPSGAGSPPSTDRPFNDHMR